jgi:hypothetical protein
MRKGLLFLFLGALIFAVAPAAMAGTQSNVTYDVEESAHTDYGAAEWHATWQANSANNPFAGDESWGYQQGMVPFGPGAINTYTNATEWLAPLYSDPCPADMIGTGYDMDSSGGCPIHTLTSAPAGFAGNTGSNTTFWQTANLAGDGDEALILDDMLAKMFQGDPNALDGITEGLNQTLDVLFYLDDTAATSVGANVFIDQSLDQDLVYFVGDDSSYLGSITGNAGEGIKNRITSIVEGGNQTTFGHYVDQWVVGYVKDTGGAWPEGRIVSSYSQWFQDGTENPCTVCSHTYSMGHDPIVKTVPEIDQHP